jgi:hypothetical protein
MKEPFKTQWGDCEAMDAPGTNPVPGRLMYAKQTVLESFRRSSHSMETPGEGHEFNQNSTPYGRYYTRSTAAPAI